MTYKLDQNEIEEVNIIANNLISSAGDEEFKNQIRNYYDLLLKAKEKAKENKDETKTYFTLALARIGYAVARRNKNDNLKELYKTLKERQDKIETIDDLKAICEFFEMIIAFATYKNYEKNQNRTNNSRR